VGDVQALAEIKRLVQLARVLYTQHARVRMTERGARRRDVENALLEATTATRQHDRDSWRVEGGLDLDGVMT
jgi:isoaspartyl peptidase/L-asparaginase-like protein (Ntn-hydrolase superfamily)